MQPEKQKKKQGGMDSLKGMYRYDILVADAVLHELVSQPLRAAQ
jgi:hypothetical protein